MRKLSMARCAETIPIAGVLLFPCREGLEVEIISTFINKISFENILHSFFFFFDRILHSYKHLNWFHSVNHLHRSCLSFTQIQNWFLQSPSSIWLAEAHLVHSWFSSIPSSRFAESVLSVAFSLISIIDFVLASLRLFSLTELIMSWIDFW